MSDFNGANTVVVREGSCGGVSNHTTVGLGPARRLATLSGIAWHYLPWRTPQRDVDRRIREAQIVSKTPLDRLSASLAKETGNHG